MIDDKSDPGSWAEFLSIAGWIRARFKIEERPVIEDFDTPEGSHVHAETTGEYEAITEWCDESSPRG